MTSHRLLLRRTLRQQLSAAVPLTPARTALIGWSYLMPLYRCHFLDNRDRITAHEEIDAGSLVDAIDRANAMLDERSHHNVVEVCAGNRWMYRAGRGRPADIDAEGA